VLLVEPDAARRKVAEANGIETIDPRADDPIATVNAWAGAAGADVAFEVSGTAAGVTTAVDVLAVRGRLVMVAIHSRSREVSLFQFFLRELELVGARLYQREDFVEAVRLMASGAIPAASLISRIEPLDRAAAAFDALEHGGVMKVLVDCQGLSR
jgi:threonine dehydrogenase-like Zn-dependent dehydrogenase